MRAESSPRVEVGSSRSTSKPASVRQDAGDGEAAGVSRVGFTSRSGSGVAGALRARPGGAHTDDRHAEIDPAGDGAGALGVDLLAGAEGVAAGAGRGGVQGQVPGASAPAPDLGRKGASADRNSGLGRRPRALNRRSLVREISGAIPKRIHLRPSSRNPRANLPLSRSPQAHRLPAYP